MEKLGLYSMLASLLTTIIFMVRAKEKTSFEVGAVFIVPLFAFLSFMIAASACEGLGVDNKSPVGPICAFAASFIGQWLAYRFCTRKPSNS